MEPQWLIGLEEWMEDVTAQEWLMAWSDLVNGAWRFNRKEKLMELIGFRSLNEAHLQEVQ